MNPSEVKIPCPHCGKTTSFADIFYSGWKEIQPLFKRDRRTLKKWAKEGFPIAMVNGTPTTSLLAVALYQLKNYYKGTDDTK